MYSSEENREMRALYQFGDPQSTTNRATSDVEPTAASPAEETHYESYSPRAADGPGTPTTPAAFGTANDAYVPNPSSSPGYAASTSLNASPDTQHHKEGSKKNVIKKILGTDKKSTKNMTDEEKKAVKLEERWNNAILEEQRLNELDKRVAQEEQLTNTVAEAPNFPPKILCIHPLVFHKISVVRAERRRFVKMAFWDWVAVCIILIANCPITIACNYAPYKSSIDKSKVRDINKALNTVLACIYLIGIPLSFLIWYFPIYNSNYKMIPTQHIVALCGLIVALAQSIFAFVGPYSYGFCGILSSKWVGETRATGVVAPMAIVTALWGAQAIFTCYMIGQVFVYYRRDLAARRAQRRQQALSGQ